MRPRALALLLLAACSRHSSGINSKPLRRAPSARPTSAVPARPSFAAITRRKSLIAGLAAATLLAPRPAEASFGSARGAVTSPPKLKTGFDLQGLEALDPVKQAQVESALLPSQADQLLKELEQKRTELQARLDSLARDITRDRDIQTLETKVKQAEEKVQKLEAELQQAEARQALLYADEKRDGADSRSKRSPTDAPRRVRLPNAQPPPPKAETLREQLERLLEDQRDAKEELTEQQARVAKERAEFDAAVQRAQAELKQKQELEDRIAKRARILAALNAQPDWFNYVAAFVSGSVSTSIMHPLDTLKTRQVAAVTVIADASGMEGSVAPTGGGGASAPAGEATAGQGGTPDGTGTGLDGSSTAGGTPAAAGAAAAPAVAAVALSAEISRAQQQQQQQQQQQAVAVLPEPTVDSAAGASSQANGVAAAAEENGVAATADQNGVAAAAEEKDEDEDEDEDEDKEARAVTAAAGAEQQQEFQWSLQEYLSLYQGITGALVKEGPPSALYLGVYEFAKARLLATTSLDPLAVYLISGALGETFGSVVRAPAEAVKSRVQSGVDASTPESVRRVLLDADGRSNVVNAWSASLWRDVPFGAIQLAIFEGLKSYIINSPNVVDFDVDTLMAEAVLGATGGAVGAFLTTPMDVITTRIITQGTGEQACDENACVERLGFIDMAQRVYAEGGGRAFFTGWQARTFYWAPAIGIFLSCYCSVRQFAIAQGFFGAVVP